jgi:hypothetical protein
MSQDPISVESFAARFKNRILGNANDQAIFQGDGSYPPSDSYVAGTIFPTSEAEQNLWTTKSTPNSLTVRFWTNTCPEKVVVTASFWLYVRYREGSFDAVMNFVDFYNEQTVWTPWVSAMRWTPSIANIVKQRLRKTFLKQGTPYLRKRFVECVESAIKGEGETVHVLDFEAYRQAIRKHGEELNLSFMASKWVGQVRTEAQKRDEGWEITLTLENLYKGKTGATDPVFYDVCLDCEVEGAEILSQEGKKLGLSTTDDIYALAYNATLEEEKASHIRATQIGQVRRLRKVPVERPICPSFEEVAENPQKALTDFLPQLTKSHVSEEFRKEVDQGVPFLLKDSNALEAFRLVNTVFAKSPNLEGGVWRFHQLVAFLQCVRLYFQQFLQGVSRITPLALNVPTAGGKTEAFTAFAMWAATYARLEGFLTRDYSIVKYPTTLLASDQLQRAATYIMLLDEELKKRSLEECGVGIMMGRKEEKTDDILELSQRVWDQLNACPYCGARWEGSVLQKGFAISTCMNGHRLNLALPEWTFHALPGLILSTVDKLAAMSYGSSMTHLMGAETKLCPVHGHHLGDKCKEFKCNRPLAGPARRARCVFIVLDEAHLLAEDRGTLDSHYETAFTELVSRITGHHPLFMISTATIRGVEHHLRHLGFLHPDERPILIPPSEDRDKFFTPTDQTHHVVLAVTPRKRAITFALPSIIDHYFDTLVLDFGVKRKSIPRTNLGKLILFFTSYRNLYDTREEYNRSRSYDYIKGKIKEISRDAINRDPKSVTQTIEDLEQGKYALVFSTSISSVGVDISALNAIGFFGMPTSTSAFIQTMNRVARDAPGIALLVLDPTRERDTSFYTYLTHFVTDTDKLVEEVPLNRFAQNAMRRTFDCLFYSIFNHYYVGEKEETRGRSVSAGLKVLSGNRDEIGEILDAVYRVEYAPTDYYEKRIPINLENIEVRLENSPSKSGTLYRNLSDRSWGRLIFGGAREIMVRANRRIGDAIEARVSSLEKFGGTESEGEGEA